MPANAADKAQRARAINGLCPVREVVSSRRVAPVFIDVRSAAPCLRRPLERCQGEAGIERFQRKLTVDRLIPSCLAVSA